MERDEVASKIRALTQIHTAELLQMREHWIEVAGSGKREEAELWVEAIDQMLAIFYEPHAPHPTPARPNPATSLRMKGTLFRQFASDYLDYVKHNFAEKTLENARRVIKHLLPSFGERELSSLSAEDLERFKASRLQSGVSRATVNADIRLIKAAFSVAVEWRRITGSPFRKAKQLRIDQKPKQVLSQDEFAAITSAIREGWLRDIVCFDVLTGLRLGEIMNLRWSDYNSSRSEITVRSSEDYRVKGGKMRIVPVNSDARAILEAKER